jgi:hypothetical protein
VRGKSGLIVRDLWNPRIELGVKREKICDYGSGWVLLF